MKKINPIGATRHRNFCVFIILLFLNCALIPAVSFGQTTWYSYQSGNWANGGTNWRIWTQDPSGTTLINPAHVNPAITDHVVILNGRIVTIPSGEGAKTVASVTIQEGAVLDITNTTGHNFGANLNGSGLLRLSTDVFPAFASGTFVAQGGGTVEYINMVGFTLTQFTYNNLIFNLNNNADIAVFDNATPLTINGDLTLTRGILRVGHMVGEAGSPIRTMTVWGNTLINSNAQITVGTKTIRHQFYFYGDFVNNGSAYFTTMGAAIYDNNANSGYSDVYFNNTGKNQQLSCFGPTVFYRIVISKGSDQTYVLNIDADQANRFYLYGRNDQQTSPPALGAPAIPNGNALGLLAGTVRLGPNIVIPCLAYDEVYNIDEDAQLWLDGANVTFTSATNYSSLIIYGKLRTTANSVLNANGYQGIILREFSNLVIENGTISTPCLRTSAIVGIHRGAFYMLGGTLNISGNNANVLGLEALKAYASMTIPYPENVFFMSGGTININGSTTFWASNPPPAGSGTYFSLLIGADAKNVTLTGGSINITVPNNRNAYFNSTAPLWNLNITSNSNTYSAQIMPYAGYAAPSLPAISAQPLKILNDLNIQNNAVFNAGGNHVFVSHDFAIGSNATYTPGANQTVFNGYGSQRFDMLGAITGNLNSLSLENTSRLTLNNTNAVNPVIINADLSIGDGSTLIDNGRTLHVSGNIHNSGIHFKPVSGAGSIQLTGTGDQVISGDGSGVFNNLTLNKTAGSVTAECDLSFTGNLRLANSSARFNIGIRNILFSAGADVYDDINGTGKNFNNNRMIQTAGLMSDAGVSRTYSNSGVFLFPVGFYNAANTTFYYTPYSLQFSQGASSYGSVTVKPVNGRHPFAQSNNALSCYWKVSSNGMSGVPSGSVVSSYTYDPLSDDFVSGTEAQYRPAVFRNSGVNAWTYIDDILLVNDGTNTATYDTAYKADGDYTAGHPDAFGAVPVRYSTGVNGDWNNTATWSATAVGGSGGASVPDANTMVVIGDATHNHTIVINQNGKVCGGLIISNGSVLDLKNYTGHNFEALPDMGVMGTGTLRIASNNYFPQGDFGDFIGENGGTVEYYTISPAPGSIIMPETSDVTGLPLDHYYNLKLSPVNATSITFPAIDITVYNDLTKEDAGQAYTNTAAQTITVNRDLLVSAGSFMVQGNNQKTIRVLRDLSVNGTFGVTNTADADHKLELYRNLSGAGTFDIYNAPGRMLTWFKGVEDATVTGAAKDFYSLELDKGNSQEPVLDVFSTITTNFDPQLTLRNGTFRLSAGTFNVTTNAAFTIPVTACLSANGGTLNVITADNNNNLNLVGKLEVLIGTVNVGNPSNNNRNDIEYSAGGKPEIIIGSGTLNVKGQIKRNSSTTLGALRYTQSGGNVHIFGKNQDATRAKLEICNDSSSFTFSNGIIHVYRDGGINFGDIYLRPESHNVTGGMVIFAPVAGLGALTYNIDATCNLHHITLPGNSTGNTPTVRIMVNPLNLTGNLTINTNGVFNCNNRNLFMAGDFTNNGAFITGTNITTFNGGNTQTATLGVNTSFNKLAVNKNTGTTVTFTSPGGFQPTIADTLFIYGGILSNAGTLNIIAQKSIINNSVHASSGTGSLILQGTTNQFVGGNGNGQYGNITLNNAAGATLGANAVINGQLAFTAGNLYINDYLLSFSATAPSATGSALNRCIITNGTLSDGGVKKSFPGTPSSFIFPVGVSGKYTPATYNLTANSAPGSITVKPVNVKIPSTFESPAVSNELQYYWNVSSQGFSGLTVNSVYQYMAADIQGTESNATYVGAAYRNLIWSTYSHVDDINHRFTVNGLNAGNLAGEYTCGETTNFINIPILYTAATGNWDSDIWSVANDGTPDAGLRPNNNPLVINDIHTVNVTADDRMAYSVDIQGVLNLNTTTGHNLGHVIGDGRLVMSNTFAGQFVFPGGDYTTFMDTPNSTVEYNGANPSSIISSISPILKVYQNLEFTGSHSKYMSCMNILVRGNMLITGSQLLNDVYNKNIILLGNWTDQQNNGFVPGKGLVSFEGSVPQSISTTGSEHFYNFRINNASGVTLNGPAEIAQRLYLVNGNINTTDANLLTITNTNTNSVTGGSDNSFVDGPLAKAILSGQSFSYPVGNYNAGAAKPSRYGNLMLSNVSANGTWAARYVNSDPNSLYNRSNLLAPITSVSDNEYWVVTRPGANTANVRIRWDDFSNIVSVNSTRLTEWVTNRWEEKGNVLSGNMTAGTVASSSPVTTNNYVFTLGVSGVTARITNVTPAEICNNTEEVTVTVEMTGTPNWTLTFNAGGTSFVQSGINTSTYEIHLRGADLGGAGVKNIQLTAISDAFNPGTVDATVYPVTVKDTYIPDIQGTFTVGSGEDRSFSTASHAGSTWLWSWQGADGGVITPNNAATVSVHTGAAANYQLQVTETTSNGCTASDVQAINVINRPSPDITPVDANVCENEAVTYTTAAIAGHTYSWTVIGGTFTDHGNYIDVVWTTPGNGSVSVDETYSGLTGSDIVNVVIDALPDVDLTITAPAVVCYGDVASISVNNTETGVTYQLREGAVNIGAPVAGNGGTRTLTSDNLYADTEFNVLAFNNGCSVQLTMTPDIVISHPSAPVVGTVNQPTCGVATGSVALSGLPASGSWTVTETTGFNTITGSGTTTTFPALVSGTYAFTVTDQYNCTSDESTDAVIDAQPATPNAPTVGAITQPTCAVSTGSVVLSGLPAGNWTINPGAIAGNTASTTISGLATGTHNFTVTNAAGCTSSASGNVVINAQPATPNAPTVGAITQPTCAVSTGSVVLSGLPAGNWTINPGAIAGNTASTTISGLATGTHNFTVTNAAGCTSAASGNVVINAQPATPNAPTVGAITQPTCAVSTGSVVLSGLPAGNWTINPGAIAGNTASTTISGLATGTHNFTVTNAAGCTSAASGNVVINAQPATPNAPTVGAITQPTCAVSTGSVVLSGLPAGNWTINPGAIAGNTASTTISGLATGTHNFTVTNAAGCTSAASGNVVINAQPATPNAPTVGAITQPTCAVSTGSVVLSGLPAGNWTINPGAIAGNTASTTISGLATGTHNFAVTNAAGCTSAASGNVVINAQPATPNAPTVGAITQPTCAVSTGSVVLSGLPAGNWTINPGAIAGNTASTTISGLATGTHNFTVTNAAGCTSAASGNVVINAQPATPNAPTVGAITQPTCAVSTGSVVLSGLPAGNWTINPGAIAGNTASTTISGLATGTHNFTVTNAAGCTSAASGNVVINSQPATPNAPTVGAITQPTCAVSTGSVVLSGLPAGNWTINPGAIAGNTASTTISGLATGTHNFTVTNAAGCTSAASGNVVINAQPATPNAPTVGAITQPTCAVSTGSVVLSGLPAGNWTINPGAIAGNTASTTISGLATGTHNFTVTNAAGCTSAASGNVVINAQPATPNAPTVGAITQPTCAVSTGSVVLSGLPAGNWTINPGAIAGNTASTTISGLATGTHNFTVTNAAGCTSAASGNVVINAQPATPNAPTVGAITQPTCAVSTGSVVLSGLPAGNWTINPGAIAGNTASTTISGLATGTHNFTVTNAAGCTSAASGNVVINAQPETPDAPVLDIDQATCNTATGTITVTSPSGAGITYSIDGIDYSNINGVFGLLPAGTYTITARNSDGCISGGTDGVINAQPETPGIPVIGAVVQPTCVTPVGSIELTGLPPTGTWTITECISSISFTGSGASYIYDNLIAGNYSFTVENENGCISDTTEITEITEATGCGITARFNADRTVACENEIVLFTDATLGADDTTDYIWVFGEGAVPDSAFDKGPHSVFYATPGMKSVKLIVNNGFADTLIKHDFITVNTAPSVSVETSSICGAGSVEFVASTNGDQVDFSLDAGATVVSKDQTVPYKYSADVEESSSVEVWVRAVNTATGCQSAWDTSVIAHGWQIPVAEEILATHAGNYPEGFVDVVCSGSQGLVYYVNGDPSATYNWNIPDAGFEAQDTMQITVNWTEINADYVIQVQKISSGGCSSSIRDTMVKVSKVKPELGADVDACDGDQVVFETETDYASYKWQDNSTSPEYTATQTGAVSVLVADEFGCQGGDTVVVTFHANPVVDLGPDTVVCEDNSVTLDAGDFESYNWSNGQTGNPITVQEGAGIVSVTVTDMNGCEATDEIEIGDCTPEYLLVIPNTFTPNGDKYHDTWKIINIDMFPDADIQVFDRWGRRVFQSKGESGDEWDGTGPNGNDLPVETYYYIIDLKVTGKEPLSGTISLVR